MNKQTKTHTHRQYGGYQRKRGWVGGEVERGKGGQIYGDGKMCLW